MKKRMKNCYNHFQSQITLHLLRFALTPFLLLFMLPVYAGHYVPSYSGGHIAPTFADGTSASYPYINPDANNCYGSQMNLDWTDGYGGPANKSTSVKCSGTITTTFNWTHDTVAGENDANDPPPPLVVIREYCVCSWASYSDRQDDIFKGKCDNGLGFAEIDSAVMPYNTPKHIINFTQRGHSGQNLYYRFQIKSNPGWNFVIPQTCDVSPVLCTTSKVSVFG